MYYWTLFLIIGANDVSFEEKYIGIQSFDERGQCELSILKEKIIKNNIINGKLRCIKTDEFIGVWEAISS